MPQVAVVGGGVIGLAIAHRARERGLDAVVYDAGTPSATSVAAGMLAPVSEAEFGEEALLHLGLESLRRYPAFAAELGVPLHERGTLLVARDADEAADLERLLRFRRELGLPVERLLPTQARRLEPALAPSLRLALRVPDDQAVDPRALRDALAARVPVERREIRDLDELAGAEQVVVAAGAWSAALHPELPVRPVKGQVLRLRDPRGAGLVDRVVRTAHAYLVPRPDGRYVIGATVEERGWDVRPTAGGVFELIRDLSEVVPGVLEMELEECGAGVRPGTPDNRPLIGRLDERTIAATGHYRNGILLAPVTADLVAGLLAGDAADEALAPFDPRRFAAGVRA